MVFLFQNEIMSRIRPNATDLDKQSAFQLLKSQLSELFPAANNSNSDLFSLHYKRIKKYLLPNDNIDFEQFYDDVGYRLDKVVFRIFRR